MSIFGSNNDKHPEKITVIAQIRAKSGQEDVVRKAFEGIVGPSSKEAGCISYRLFEDHHYTGSFYTIEEWESEDALDTHLRVNKAALDKSKALLREELRISVLKNLA